MENHLLASLAVTVIKISMSDSPQRPWGLIPSWSVPWLPGLTEMHGAEIRKGGCSV